MKQIFFIMNSQVYTLRSDYLPKIQRFKIFLNKNFTKQVTVSLDNSQKNFTKKGTIENSFLLMNFTFLLTKK